VAGPRGSSDRADRGVGHCGRSPRSSTTRLPCLGPRQIRGSRARLSRKGPRTKRRGGRFLVCNLLSTDLTPVHVCRSVWEAVGCSLSSWQPELGVGRYGESVPLLLIWRESILRCSGKRPACPCSDASRGSWVAARAGVRHTPQKRWPAGQRPPCRFPNSSGKGHRAGKVLDNTQF
jgi:hypothetical protein